eukprot:GILK01008651.1.p1 GENE.GILK01008651.1~~GILK01008651.1.p1  ORF type:complete len:191 (+),score=15.10 GILK01008651.1:46-618(+)
MAFATIHRIADKTLNIFFAIAFEVVTVMGINYFAAKHPAMHTPAGSLYVPDFSLGLTAKELHTMFETYGESGRSAYYDVALFDLFPYMFGYSILLTLLLSRALRFANLRNTLFDYVCLLPSISHISDIVENVSVISLLKSHPHVDPLSLAAFTAGVRTKWCVFAITLVLLVCLFIRGLMRTATVPEKKKK